MISNRDACLKISISSLLFKYYNTKSVVERLYKKINKLARPFLHVTRLIPSICYHMILFITKETSKIKNVIIRKNYIVRCTPRSVDYVANVSFNIIKSLINRYLLIR